MPELVWKQLVTADTHRAPARDPKTGKLSLQSIVVDRNRIRHFFEEFRRLKAQGVHIPIPFGHKLLALPQQRIDSQEEWRKAIEARNQAEVLANAGYIEDMRIGEDGSLEFAMYPPPGYEVCQQTHDLINPTTGNRIREVSAGIGNWTDGKGQTHKDIIVHAALCTLPVIAGMSGFRPTGPLKGMTQLSTSSIEYICFLSTRTGEQAMADEKVDDKVDETPADDEQSLYEDEAPAEEPADEEKPEDTGNKKDHYEQCVAMLQDMGVPLPADTNEKNFCERLLTALTALNHHGAKFEMEKEEENETSQAPATGTSEQPVAQSPPGIMMSTRALKDPIARNLAIDKEKQLQKEFVRSWEGLKKIGVPVDICDEHIQQATQIQLSVNSKTHKFRVPADLKLVRELTKILGRVLGGEKEVQTQLASARPEANPTQVAAAAKDAKDNPGPRVMSDGESLASFLERHTKRSFGPLAKPKIL